MTAKAPNPLLHFVLMHACRTNPLQKGLLSAVSSIAFLVSWMQSCAELLPQIHWPLWAEALSRLGLVLAASLLLIVVVSTIDSSLLQLYVSTSRRFV